MVKIFAVMGVLALAVLFGRAALMPGDVVVETAIVIEAPPKPVMAFLDNFHGWGAWSPLERKNPGLVRRYSGPASGVGASYAWSSAGEDGSGRMTIAAQSANALRVDIVQTAPLPLDASLEFGLETIDEGTRVTAKFAGHHSLWTRLRHPLGVPASTLESGLDDALTYLKLVVEGTEPS